MTDRELLKDAAKAAGYSEPNWPPRYGYDWNPLDDDGDAFQLAVKLRISVLQPNRPEDRGVIAMWDSGGGVREPTDPNPAAATRRAIVRAAAEIGKEMK